MHRKRKLLATVVLVFLVLVYFRRNTASRNNRRLEIRSVLQPAECKQEIVWLVHSSLTNFESRSVIRESYSSQELNTLGVVRIFVLGMDSSYQQYSNGKSVGNVVGVDDEKIKSINNINSNTNVKSKLESNINANVHTNINNIFHNSKSKINSIKKRHIPITTMPRKQLLIMQEHERYGDLLQADFLDTYRNLTLKHIAGLNYTITHCPKILHIFKSDDDVIIDVSRIVALMQGSISNDSGNARGNSNVWSNEYFINNADSDINNSYSGTERNINNNGDTNNNYKNNYHQHSNGNTNTSIGSEISAGTDVYSNSTQSTPKNHNVKAGALSYTSISQLNIFGFKMANKLVERNPDSKWFVTDEEYSGNYYPSFVSGWLYFTSKPVVEALLQNYVEYTRSKDEFWIDDVFVTGMLRDGVGVEVVGLNEMYAVDYRYLQCCVKDLSRNLHCDYAAGPDGARKSLHKEFKEFLDHCRHRCKKRTKENSVKNTCIVAYNRDEDIGNGKPMVESV